MKAVILAAGEGKRMHPLTRIRPKVMLPLANKPILEYLLLEARKAGIREFILVVGYHGEAVRDYFGKGEQWEVSIDYVTQRKQLGTAHALSLVEGLVKGKFLVANGDVLIKEKDIRRLAQRDNISLTLIEVENLRDLGAVEVEGERVKHIYEKVAHPPTSLANAGLYLFTEDIFPALSKTGKSPRGEYELTDTLQLLIDQGYPLSYQLIDYWLDLSYPWDLLAANEHLLKMMEPENRGMLEENVIIRGPVSIGEGTVVRSHSYIAGPVIVGKNCDIGPNCYIRPYTAIGDGCHIGAAVEVKNCIIMKGSRIPHHNYVGDSIIGEGCNFGAGTKIANLRLDKKEIEMLGIKTGRQKLGAIIGDGVQTGINATINVGSIIGNDTYIGPGAIASGIVMPESRIF
jgi:bifunctional UDP-N-acetylglucosamine pyrophosphorylase/glucosamine-1-phosphate N-acetyltransferase